MNTSHGFPIYIHHDSPTDYTEPYTYDPHSCTRLISQLYATHIIRQQSITGHLRRVHHQYPEILEDYFKALDMLKTYLNGDFRFINDLRNHKQYLDKVDEIRFKDYRDETGIYIPGSQHIRIVRAFIQKYPHQKND